MNYENLTLFFTKYNTFKYKGDFFFKDARFQSEMDKARMTADRTDNMFKSLLDQNLGQKIRNYFSYLPSEYNFEIKNLTHFNSYQLNTLYSLKFQLKITSLKNNFNFIQDNLVLQFTETKQYDEQRWLTIYLDYLESWGSFLWAKKYPGFENNGHLPNHPFAKWTTEDDKKAFTKNNDDTVLGFLSKYYTNLFSNQGIEEDLWLYQDKQFQVNTLDYQYLGPTPCDSNGQEGVRAQVTLLFTSFENFEITATKSYELWMEYSHV
ncbi:translocator protein [Spiroplasma sp. SV19]|uniref:translocator protein n=1 Tax=Spiroplasma sp. SV19 TaxID=2570468 RepID=UPI0024B6A992|nr:translocator protein [Spiroplasma sp. SV19]